MVSATQNFSLQDNLLRENHNLDGLVNIHHGEHSKVSKEIIGKFAETVTMEERYLVDAISHESEQDVNKFALLNTAGAERADKSTAAPNQQQLVGIDAALVAQLNHAADLPVLNLDQANDLLAGTQLADLLADLVSAPPQALATNQLNQQLQQEFAGLPSNYHNQVIAKIDPEHSANPATATASSASVADPNASQEIQRIQEIQEIQGIQEIQEIQEIQKMMQEVDLANFDPNKITAQLSASAKTDTTNTTDLFGISMLKSLNSNVNSQAALQQSLHQVLAEQIIQIGQASFLTAPATTTITATVSAAEVGEIAAEQLVEPQLYSLVDPQPELMLDPDPNFALDGEAIALVDSGVEPQLVPQPEPILDPDQALAPGGEAIAPVDPVVDLPLDPSVELGSELQPEPQLDPFGDYIKIFGSEDKDKITGTSADEAIFGGDGDDKLAGKNGNDYIYGEAGDDKIAGGDGNDNLYGGAGDDDLDGNDGNDNLYGGDGADKIAGGDGNDWLYGEAGDDKLHGGDGNDVISGGAGNDEAWGNSGDDTYLFGSNAGNDKFHGGGDSWLDKIALDFSADDVVTINQYADSWVIDLGTDSVLLSANKNFTVNDNVLSFNNSALGTLTLSDGSTLDFDNIEQITWNTANG